MRSRHMITLTLVSLLSASAASAQGDSRSDLDRRRDNMERVRDRLDERLAQQHNRARAREVDRSQVRAREQRRDEVVMARSFSSRTATAERNIERNIDRNFERNLERTLERSINARVQREVSESVSRSLRDANVAMSRARLELERTVRDRDARDRDVRDSRDRRNELMDRNNELRDQIRERTRERMELQREEMRQLREQLQLRRRGGMSVE